MALRRPGIPAIGPSVPQDIRQVLEALKEAAEISMGVRSSGQQQGSGVGFNGWQRRSFTLGMAVKAGLLTEAQAQSLFNSQD